MRIGKFKSFVVEVMLRDEHCPPHVHVETGDWCARFKFAYWHDDVDIYSSKGKAPSQPVIAAIAAYISTPSVLKAARIAFWKSVNSVCLRNKLWDSITNMPITREEAATTGYPCRRIVRETFLSEQGIQGGLAVNTYETEIELEDLTVLVLPH